jgi:hypothetical protein
MFQRIGTVKWVERHPERVVVMPGQWRFEYAIQALSVALGGLARKPARVTTPQTQELPRAGPLLRMP